MAINMGKMKKGYESHQRGGDFWTPEVGDTLVYIHPQCRTNDKYEPTEGVNYIECAVHYSVGSKNQMVVSLDPSANPIVEHPFVKAFLKKRKIKLDGTCPVHQAMDNGEMSDDEADESRRQVRFLWGVTPLKHRGGKSEEWRKLPGKPSVAMVGKSIYDGLMELFIEAGDITEMDGAVLALVHREGKGKNDTRYKVSADVPTLKKPLKLPSKLRKRIEEAMKEGGDCDLFKVIGNLIKSPADVRAALSGVTVEDSTDDDDDWEDDDSDDEAEVDDDSDDEDDDDADDDDDDEDDDDSDDDDDDSDDEDDDDADDDDDDADDDEDDDDADDDEEDDDDSDDEDEEDEEEDEEPPPPPKKTKAKAKAKSKVKPKPKPAAAKKDGDDDLGLDALDDELTRISKGGKSKKAKAKSKG